MFQCHVCGSEQARQDFVTQVFLLDDKPVIVHDIPAKVCVRCGESVFDISTIEKIRRMVHGEAVPVKSVVTEVFEFARSSQRNPANLRESA